MTKEEKQKWCKERQIFESDLDSVISEAIAEHEAFTREIIVRANLDFPLNEQELDWFEEGTDAARCPEFMQKIMNTKPMEGGKMKLKEANTLINSILLKYLESSEFHNVIKVYQTNNVITALPLDIVKSAMLELISTIREDTP